MTIKYASKKTSKIRVGLQTGDRIEGHHHDNPYSGKDHEGAGRTARKNLVEWTAETDNETP